MSRRRRLTLADVDAHGSADRAIAAQRAQAEVMDERSLQKRALARAIADKIANYYRGYLGMRISYEPDRLWLVLEAVRDDLMREAEHHPYIPRELKIEIAKGVSGLAKSWDWIEAKEKEGGFAWWLAILVQLVEDQVEALDALGVTWEKRQGPLSDLPKIEDRKILPDPTAAEAPAPDGS